MVRLKRCRSPPYRGVVEGATVRRAGAMADNCLGHQALCCGLATPLCCTPSPLSNDTELPTLPDFAEDLQNLPDSARENNHSLHRELTIFLIGKNVYLLKCLFFLA